MQAETARGGAAEEDGEKIMRDEIITKMKEAAEDIFCHPELSMQETYSSRRLAGFLESEGFEVCWGTGGFETAFTAEWGSGRPVI